jgi:hypothetical protein
MNSYYNSPLRMSCNMSFTESRFTRQRPAAAKLRSWRVIIIRSKGEHLGTVEAVDRERAEAAAIKYFDLDQDQRGRLLILERS